MSEVLTWPIGARVRVKACSPSDFVGLVGTVGNDRDCFGRYGVRLDAKPKKHKHWFHWFPAEHLEPESGEHKSADTKEKHGT